MSKNISKKLALAALECGALSLNTKSPFRWASGYFMPVYNDNRLLLGSPDNRKLVSEGLAELCEGMKPNLISGCATAGICLLYTSPSPRDRTRSRMPSSA